MKPSKEGGDAASSTGGDGSMTAATFPFPLPIVGTSRGKGGGGGGGGGVDLPHGPPLSLYLLGGQGMVVALRYHRVATLLGIVYPEVW